jgi:hypothetical protein
MPCWSPCSVRQHAVLPEGPAPHDDAVRGRDVSVLAKSLPSSTLTTATWARLLAFSQSVCALGRCKSRSAAAGPTVFWSVIVSAGRLPGTASAAARAAALPRRPARTVRR